jgi:uncharacterized repeat protein (TIGR01451 family)
MSTRVTARKPRTALRATVAALATGVAFAAFATSALAAPPEPVYSESFADCVTGDNQFWAQSNQKYRWYTNQTPEAGVSSVAAKCDSYQHEQYERPTSQTFLMNQVITDKPAYTGGRPAPFLSGLAPDSEFAEGASVFSTDSGIYHEYLDITRADAGHAGDWMFFRTELFGTAEVNSDAVRVNKFGEGTYYTVRIGTDPNANKANGGILLRNQLSNAIPTTWHNGVGDTQVKIFADRDGTASGAGVDVTKTDGDPQSNGHEVDKGNNDWLWVRRVTTTFNGVNRPAVEFALNYVKYNAENGSDTDITPQNVRHLLFDTTRGLKDNQNTYWNDEYTLLEAGSPNPGQIPGQTGTQNIYELDTLLGGGFTPPPAGLKIKKTPDNDFVNAGDPISFAIEIESIGPGTAKGVTLSDPLPAGVDWSTSSANCSITGAYPALETLNCSYGDLPAGEKRPAAVTAMTSFANCAVYNNTATVSATNADPKNDDGKITCKKPNLTIEKTPDNQTVQAGAPISFDITISNSGPGVAKGVTISDPLPPGVDWSETSADCVITGAVNAETLNCSYGDLAANDPRSVTVTAQTSFANCAIYNNTATVSATNSDPKNDDGRITCLGTIPNLKIVKSGPASVAFGSTITYTIGVSHGNASNGQPIAKADVKVTDPKVTNAQLVYVSGDDADDMLEMGETWMYQVTAQLPATLPADVCGEITNTAILAAVEGETNLTDNESSTTTTVICSLDVAIVKTSDKQEYVPGDTITYTITVTNTGQRAIPVGQIQVSDPMITLALEGAVPAELLPGQSLVYKGSRSATAAICGKLVNTATVAYSGPNGPETTTLNNTAGREVTIVCTPPVTPPAAPQPLPAVAVAGLPARAKLSINKQGPRVVVAGAVATYRITVKNTGKVTAKRVVLKDVLPGGFVLAGKAKGATLRAGTLTWTGADIAPGQTKSVTLRVRVDRTISGRRCNLGMATADNADAVRDTACTKINAVKAAIQPAVTG